MVQVTTAPETPPHKAAEFSVSEGLSQLTNINREDPVAANLCRDYFGDIDIDVQLAGLSATEITQQVKDWMQAKKAGTLPAD